MLTFPVSAGGVQSIKNKVVRIRGAIDGSGVIVSSENNQHSVLTAWHVINSNRSGEELTIFSLDGGAYDTDISNAERIGKTDMAIISFKSLKSFGDPIAVNKGFLGRSSKLKVSGFPTESGGAYISTNGRVMAHARQGIDQGYQLLYTNSTSSGMSGGPILDEKNLLVGIHGRGERFADHSDRQLGGKTNINLGIPIKFYIDHVSGVPVSLNEEGPEDWDYLFSLFMLNLYEIRGKTPDEKNKFFPSTERLMVQAEALNPNSLTGQIWKQKFYSYYGQTDKEEAVSSKINSLNKILSDLYIDAKEFAKKGDEASAVNLVEEAKKIDDFSEYYYWNSSKVFVELGQDPIAIFLLREMIDKITENKKYGYFSYANMFGRNCSLDCMLSLAHFDLAEIFHQNENFDQAIEHGLKSLKFYVSPASGQITGDLSDSIYHNVVPTPPGKSWQVSVSYSRLSAALYGAYKPFDMVCATANHSFKFNHENIYRNPGIAKRCKLLKRIEANAPLKPVKRIAKADCRLLTSVFKDKQDQLPIPLHQQVGIWSTILSTKNNKDGSPMPPLMKQIYHWANIYSELVVCPTLFERSI